MSATRADANKQRYQSVWGERQVATKEAMRDGSGPQRAEYIFSHLSKHPEGARGEIAVQWTFGGAHSMAWEVVNGKPVIIDAQSSKMYDQKAFSHYAHSVMDAGYTRTDNKQLDEHFLRRWMTNAD